VYSFVVFIFVVVSLDEFRQYFHKIARLNGTEFPLDGIRQLFGFNSSQSTTKEDLMNNWPLFFPREPTNTEEKTFSPLLKTSILQQYRSPLASPTNKPSGPIRRNTVYSHFSPVVQPSFATPHRSSQVPPLPNIS
jgi:hypothetical protein